MGQKLVKAKTLLKNRKRDALDTYGCDDIEIVDADNFGEDTVSELSDTTITSPQDGAVLSYQASSGKWIDENVIDGGSYQP